VTAPELARRIDLLRRIALHDGGRISEALATAGLEPGGPGPIADALATLIRDGLVATQGQGGGVAYHVPRHRRAELDFFRNNVLHHFVAYAIIAAAQAVPRGTGQKDEGDGDDGGDADGRAGLERDTRWLSRLFKLEFMYRVGARFETIFAETLAAMAALGLAGGGEATGASVARGPTPTQAQAQALPSGGARGFLAEMTRPYADAYRAAASTLLAWPGGDRRSFVKSALQRAHAEVAANRALPESASKATLENAAAWLEGEGALERPASGTGASASTSANDRLRVAPAWRDGAARTLVADIDRFRHVDEASASPELSRRAARPGRG
jgi:glycerol-3-phosphate O-acyltransferase